MKQFRCFKCCQIPYLSPVLKQSGYSIYSGRDLICPICDTMYNSITGKEFDEEEYNIKQERLKSISDYKYKWFNV